LSEALPPALTGVRRGIVRSYDRARGLGEVVEAGGARYGFHATAIADGSRMIEVDTEVAFLVVAGHQGRYEARSLEPVAVADAASLD
jgi:cold shock CspA family protein